jgi:hypothetical protein
MQYRAFARSLDGSSSTRGENVTADIRHVVLYCSGRSIVARCGRARRKPDNTKCLQIVRAAGDHASDTVIGGPISTSAAEGLAWFFFTVFFNGHGPRAPRRIVINDDTGGGGLDEGDVKAEALTSCVGSRHTLHPYLPARPTP